MPDEDQLSLRQADQIPGDLYALQDDLDSIKVPLARLPTRNELWRAAKPIDGLFVLIGLLILAVVMLGGLYLMPPA